MPAEDYYGLLGVPRGADRATIRRAYQKLARRLHPEIHPDDPDAEGRFRRLVEAYEVLSDPERRRLYDRGERDPALLLGRRPRLRARRLRVERSVRIEEVVGDLIGPEGEEGGGPPRAGSDLTTEIALGFEEAIRGATVALPVHREGDCEACGGSGEGAGGACPRCAGRGRVVEAERIRVRIPPGVADGSRVRVRGKGDPGGGDAAPGDLYVVTRVRPHPYFRRSGADILAELPVTVAEASLGAQVEVPTIDGPVRVRIPPGTQGGQRFRLRGRGAPAPEGGRGDHYYTVRVAVPRGADCETRELLEKLGQEDPRQGLPREPL